MMVEEIAETFEKAMKKGFIRILTLLVLDKEPMHGRQIKRAIEDRTFSVWTPSDSTIYTILGDLREKHLIKPSDQQTEDDKTIIYEITTDGKNTLEIMMKKEQEIRESMRSIITTTFGFKDEFVDKEAKNFLNPRTFLDKMFLKPENETLQALQFQKIFIKKRLEILAKMLQTIEDKISKFESEKQNEN